MTARSVPEWIGATPDTAIPPRVRLRVFERAGRRCEECSRPLLAGDKWQADHVLALINGGENREGNLRCICDWCHKAKTASDVAEKSRTYRRRLKDAGIRETKRPMPGSRNSPYRKKMNGEVVPR